MLRCRGTWGKAFYAFMAGCTVPWTREKGRGGFAFSPLGTAPAVPGTALAEDGAQLCSVCPCKGELLVLHGVNTALRLPRCNSPHLLWSWSSCPAVRHWGWLVQSQPIGTAGCCCLHTAEEDHGGRVGRAQKYSPYCNSCQAGSSRQSRVFPWFPHFPCWG